MQLAYQYFNESAYAGSADGMFNLASVYLTGVGVDQSFQKAVLWYTHEEAINVSFCPLQEKFHTFDLRGLRNISEAP